MTPEQFTYWLQGFSEIAGNEPITQEKWKVIKDHLSTVFHKVTPPYESGNNNILLPYKGSPKIDNPFNQPTVIC